MVSDRVDAYKRPEVAITDSHGNQMSIPLERSYTPPDLPAVTRDLADKLGTERKVRELAKVQKTATP